MSNQIYRKRNFIVIPVCDGYVVVNTNKVFKEGHTHIQNFSACQRVIDLSIKKKIPKESSNYILTSLIRLTEDTEYKNKIQELIDVREIKGYKPKCIRRRR